MIVTTAILLLLSVLPASSQGSVTETETLFCERTLLEGRPRAWITIEVDRSHQPIKRALRVFSRSYSATWTSPTAHFDAARPLHSLEIGAIALPTGSSFPVTADLRFDGETVWRRVFARPTARIVQFSAPPPAPASDFPDIAIEMSSGEVPSLFGVSRAEIVITSEDGSTLTTHHLPMIDWATLESRVVRAFAELEYQRLRRGCRPHFIVGQS